MIYEVREHTIERYLCSATVLETRTEALCHTCKRSSHESQSRASVSGIDDDGKYFFMSMFLFNGFGVLLIVYINKT